MPTASLMPSRRVSATPFIVGACLCLLSLVATYWLFVGTATGQYIDETALTEARAVRSNGGARWELLTDLPVFCAVVGAVIVLIIAAARRRWLAALIAVIAMAAANVSTQLIKSALERSDHGISEVDFNSLPSGHTTVAASAAAAVFLLSSPRWRPFVAFVGASFTVASGTSLLLNLWHRPADVIAALFVVGFYTALASWAIAATGRNWNVGTVSARRFWAESRFWPALGALLGLASAVVAGVATASLRLSGAQRSISYLLSGISMIVLVGYLLSALLLLLMARLHSQNSSL